MVFSKDKQICLRHSVEQKLESDDRKVIKSSDRNKDYWFNDQLDIR
jgi:hypothetical protein